MKTYGIGNSIVCNKIDIDPKYKEQVDSALKIISKRNNNLVFSQALSTHEQMLKNDGWVNMIKNSKDEYEPTDDVLLNKDTFVTEYFVSDVSIKDSFLKEDSSGDIDPDKFNLVADDHVDLNQNRGDQTETKKGKSICENINKCPIHNMQVVAVVNTWAKDPKFYITEGLQRIMNIIHGNITADLKVSLRIIFVNFDMSKDRFQSAFNNLCWMVCRAHLNSLEVTKQQEILISRNPLTKATTHEMLEVFSDNKIKSNGCENLPSRFEKGTDMTINVCLAQKSITNYMTGKLKSIKTYNDELKLDYRVITKSDVGYFERVCHSKGLSMNELNIIQTRELCYGLLNFIKKSIGVYSVYTIRNYIPAISLIFGQLSDHRGASIKKHLTELLMTKNPIDEEALVYIKRSQPGGSDTGKICAQSIVDWAEDGCKRDIFPFKFKKTIDGIKYDPSIDHFTVG